MDYFKCGFRLTTATTTTITLDEVYLKALSTHAPLATLHDPFGCWGLRLDIEIDEDQQPTSRSRAHAARTASIASGLGSHLRGRIPTRQSAMVDRALVASRPQG